MPKFSNDPYGDFVVRVMNSVRIAMNASGRMNDGEDRIVKAVRDALIRRDPDATKTVRANIIIRKVS